MLEVSVTGLGELEKCERCFWYRTKRIFKPAIFPTILTALDGLQKRDTALRTQKGQRIRWLAQGTALPGITKRMKATYNGVTLKGEIDELVKVPNGYKVIDYKSSASPYDLDKANHYYQTQLSAYAFLCEQNGFRPVVAAQLVYYCPSLLDDVLLSVGIFPVSVTINIPKVKQLLTRASEVMQMPSPPLGSSCDWCRYCEDRMRYR
jgi:RecB family exonuclease